MPNRTIREGFVDSEALNGPSDWAHRVYTNLLIKADDAGRFDGRLAFMRSSLFPLGANRPDPELAVAMDELDKAKLIIRYDVDSKPFLQITKVQRWGRTTTSRYPWRDGSHTIRYVGRETRDGAKEFVESSLLIDSYPMPMGSPPHADGVGIPSAPHGDGITAQQTYTGTGTSTKTCTSAAPTHTGSSSTGEGVGKDGPVTEAHRQAAYQAFDHWSTAWRGYPLQSQADEHRHVNTLLDVLAQEPPVVQGGQQVARHLLVPLACEWAAKNRKDFRVIKYATAVVNNALADWARDGVPGHGGKNGSIKKPAKARGSAGVREDV